MSWGCGRNDFIIKKAFSYLLFEVMTSFMNDSKLHLGIIWSLLLSMFRPPNSHVTIHHHHHHHHIIVVNTSDISKDPFIYFLFSFFLFFYFHIFYFSLDRNKIKLNFEATAKVQARKWAFACRESSFDARRLKADDVGAKPAAQQTIKRCGCRHGDRWI